jgi:hypothetical protein
VARLVTTGVDEVAALRRLAGMQSIVAADSSQFRQDWKHAVLHAGGATHGGYRIQASVSLFSAILSDLVVKALPGSHTRGLAR